MMPSITIHNEPYLDGGLRDVAPLKQVIKSGADQIICILCQSENLGATDNDFRPGNLRLFAERIMEIVVNEIVNNDVKRAKSYNKFLPEDGSPAKSGLLIGKRRLEISIIRPKSTIHIDIGNFNSQNIKELIELGELAGQDYILEP